MDEIKVEIMEPCNLNSMKYSELQKLAKKHGIKANMKCEKLRSALSTFFNDDDSFGANDIQLKPTNEQFDPKISVSKDRMSGERKDKRKRSSSVLDVASQKRFRASSTIKNSPVVSGKRRTFDKPAPDVLIDNGAENDNRNRKSRVKKSGDNEKASSNEDGDQKSSSPGVHEMIEVMKDDMTDNQMKNTLLEALDKRVKTKHKEYDSLATNLSHIPVFSRSKKPITPGNKNWEGIHGKQFSKMESIDEYLRRKNQRTERLTTSMKKKQKTECLSMSMKKMQMLTQKMKKDLQNVKQYNTPPSLLKRNTSAAVKSKTALFQSPHSKPFVPTVTSTSKANFNFAATKTPARKPFVPTVTSTSKANFNFGNRRSPRLAGPTEASRNSKENISQIQNRTTSVLNKTGTTPFKFTGSTKKSTLLDKSQNTSLNIKPKFDLKASLAKPLTWKPHSGKLKPLDVKDLTGNSRKNGKAREECRRSVVNRRAERKNNIAMQRRGVN